MTYYVQADVTAIFNEDDNTMPNALVFTIRLAVETLDNIDTILVNISKTEINTGKYITNKVITESIITSYTPVISTCSVHDFITGKPALEYKFSRI